MNLDRIIECLNRQCVARDLHEQTVIDRNAAKIALNYTLSTIDDQLAEIDRLLLLPSEAQLWRDRAGRSEEERFRVQREADAYAAALSAAGIDPSSVLAAEE